MLSPERGKRSTSAVEAPQVSRTQYFAPSRSWNLQAAAVPEHFLQGHFSEFELLEWRFFTARACRSTFFGGDTSGLGNGTFSLRKHQGPWCQTHLQLPQVVSRDVARQVLVSKLSGAQTVFRRESMRL